MRPPTGLGFSVSVSSTGVGLVAGGMRLHRPTPAHSRSDIHPDRIRQLSMTEQRGLQPERSSKLLAREIWRSAAPVWTVRERDKLKALDAICKTGISHD